jgi:spore coat protein U-like protein
MNTRLLSASALIAALALANSASAAGPTSGQIIIKGTVGDLCEIGVVDYGTNLDLVTGETDRAVGRVTETCNDPDGYSVSFTSDRGGKMVGPRDAESPYRINYDTIGNHSLAADALLPRPDPQWNAAYELTVNVDGQDQLPAGSYNDTVTVTIAAS